MPKAVPTTDRLERLAELVESGEVAPVDRPHASRSSETAAAIDYIETVHPQGKVVIRMA